MSSTGINESLYISYRDQDGLAIYEGPPDYTAGIDMPVTVYKLTSNGIWQSNGFATWGRSTSDYHTGYIELRNVTWIQKPQLDINDIYAILVGGKW